MLIKKFSCYTELFPESLKGQKKKKQEKQMKKEKESDNVKGEMVDRGDKGRVQWQQIKWE